MWCMGVCVCKCACGVAAFPLSTQERAWVWGYMWGLEESNSSITVVFKCYGCTGHVCIALCWLFVHLYLTGIFTWHRGRRTFPYTNVQFLPQCRCSHSDVQCGRPIYFWEPTGVDRKCARQCRPGQFCLVPHRQQVWPSTRNWAR